MVFMCGKHVDNKLLATFQSRFPATRKVRSHQLNDKRKLSRRLHPTTPPPPKKKEHAPGLKIAEVERFALRPAILDECQNYFGGGREVVLPYDICLIFFSRPA